MFYQIFLWSIQYDIVLTTTRYENFRLSLNRIGQNFLSVFNNIHSRLEVQKFELENMEIDFFEHNFTTIRDYNNDVIHICKELMNMHFCEENIDKFICKFKNKLNSVTRECEFAKSTSVSSFEYFKFLQFLYQALLQIAFNKIKSDLNIILFINQKIVPFLLCINECLSKYERFYKKNMLMDLVFPKRWLYRRDEKSRCILLIDFLNDYLRSNNMKTIQYKGAYLNIQHLLHISSNLVVRSFFIYSVNPNLRKNYMKNAQNFLSSQYLQLLILDCKITDYTCNSYRELLIFFDRYFMQLKKSMIQNHEISVTFDRMNEIGKLFGSEIIVLLNSRPDDIQNYSASAA